MKLTRSGRSLGRRREQNRFAVVLTIWLITGKTLVYPKTQRNIHFIPSIHRYYESFFSIVRAACGVVFSLALIRDNSSFEIAGRSDAAADESWPRIPETRFQRKHPEKPSRENFRSGRGNKPTRCRFGPFPVGEGTNRRDRFETRISISTVDEIKKRLRKIETSPPERNLVQNPTEIRLPSDLYQLRIRRPLQSHDRRRSDFHSALRDAHASHVDT